MSHFTTAKSKIKDLKILKDALKRKGRSLEIGKSNIRGYSGEAEADAVIKGNNGYDIGFVHNAETDSFDVVTDEWGLQNYESIADPTDLLNSFSQDYGVEAIRAKAFMEGMDVFEHEADAEGTILLEVSI